MRIKFFIFQTVFSMKRLIIFTLLAMLMSQVQGQSVSGYTLISNQKNSGASTIYSRDTLVNLDTIFVPLSTKAFSLFKVDAILRCDSISGATAGSAYLQFAQTTPGNAERLTDNQVIWQTVATATLDGAGRTQYRLTADLTSNRARLLILTPNSTARRMMITYNVTLKRWSGGI